MRRLATAMVALLLAGAGIWWLDGLMPRQAWATWNGTAWTIDAQGWDVLRYSWPVALGGLVVGAGGAWLGLLWVSSRVASSDYRQRLRQLDQDKQSLAKERANLLAKREELERMHYTRLADVAKREQEATAAQLRAKDEINQARATVARMEQSLARAEKRLRNATSAAGRMRRKLKT